MIDCPRCRAQNDGADAHCLKCGQELAQPSGPRGPQPQQPVSTIEKIVPTRNPPALVGYYLGVFSIIPCIGLLLGIAAVVCGIIGYRNIRANPDTPGIVHAWVGIIVGGLSATVHIIIIILMSL